MRGTRWLLLVAIVAIITGLGITYRAQKAILRASAPPKPAALPPDLAGTHHGFYWQQSNENHATVEVSADDVLELADGNRTDLKGVTLKLYSKSGDKYDLVKSAAATLYKTEKRLYSEGEVEVTLALPKEGQPKRQPIHIKSSGVNFETETGQVNTDRPSQFEFENGSGFSTGAFYDPASHVLHLKSAVKLDWKPVGPRAKPMKIEADSLYYRETENEIWLKPWGRLTRDTTVLEGNDATIKLQESADGSKKHLRTLEASNAKGTDTYPKRKINYSAGHLFVNFNEDGQAEKITGDGDGGAHLVASSDTAETTIEARHVDLNFEPQDDEMALATVNGEGSAVVKSQPIAVAGRPIGETHVLRSEKLDMKMRPGGKEIERVVAQTPGSIEFVPNLPVQHHRTLTGHDMVISYAPQNRIELFHAVDVKTQTEPTAEEKKRNRVTSVTSSKVMDARFDPKTSRMSTIDQNGDFTYEEGDRKARAARATMDADHNLIVLDQNARMSDTSGATSADRIRMDQRTGDFTAEGNVNSSRMPEKDAKKNSQMLSGDEPMHAQAKRMDSANRNKKLHYEGNVFMWQGANRIQADVVDLDREKRTLVADGHVVTNLWEEPKDPKKKAAATPVLTEVSAQHLVYTETDRQAIYTGGSVLKRPNLLVTAPQIRAFLSDSGGDSKLEKAFAEGGAKIHQTGAAGVTYDGSADRSEYYTEEGKVLLLGGKPTMVDNKGQSTVGPQGLTYYPNDDRLIINGSEGQPVNTLLKRKKK
jgi:lipopolysaccharide export system protein LptA